MIDSSAASAAPPEPRRFQFGLRWIFLWCLAIAFVLGGMRHLALAGFNSPLLNWYPASPGDYAFDRTDAFYMVIFSGACCTTPIILPCGGVYIYYRIVAQRDGPYFLIVYLLGVLAIAVLVVWESSTPISLRSAAVNAGVRRDSPSVVFMLPLPAMAVGATFGLLECRLRRLNKHGWFSACIATVGTVCYHAMMLMNWMLTNFSFG